MPIHTIAGRLDNFLAKLVDTSADLATTPQQEFWHGVADFLRKLDDQFLTAACPMYQMVIAFASAFFAIAGKEAETLHLDLIARDEVELTAALMRSHLFHYGLFGHNASEQREAFLERTDVERIAREMAVKHREQHLAGRFLWSLWDFNPVYTMVDTGVWDDACRVSAEGISR